MFLLTVCNFLIGSAWLYGTMYLLGVQYANFGIKPISSKYELESAIPILILSNIFVYWSNKKIQPVLCHLITMVSDHISCQ